MTGETGPRLADGSIGYSWEFVDLGSDGVPAGIFPGDGDNVNGLIAAPPVVGVDWTSACSSSTRTAVASRTRRAPCRARPARAELRPPRVFAGRNDSWGGDCSQRPALQRRVPAGSFRWPGHCRPDSKRQGTTLGCDRQPAPGVCATDRDSRAAPGFRPGRARPSGSGRGHPRGSAGAPPAPSSARVPGAGCSCRGSRRPGECDHGPVR